MCVRILQRCEGVHTRRGSTSVSVSYFTTAAHVAMMQARNNIMRIFAGYREADNTRCDELFDTDEDA